MKKINVLAISAGLVVLFGVGSTAFAAPTGATIVAEGGVGYALSSGLNGVQASAPAVPGTYPVSPLYTDKMTPGARLALDYYFNNDPLNSWAFGLEGGYNYFLGQKTNASFNTTDGFNDPYTIHGKLKTSMWSSDIDFLVSEDISENASLIYKVGVAYEEMSRKFTANSTTSVGQENRFFANQNDNVSGFGGLLGLAMQYNFTKHFGMRIELDAMKGGKDIGYAQALAGLTCSF